MILAKCVLETVRCGSATVCVKMLWMCIRTKRCLLFFLSFRLSCSSSSSTEYFLIDMDPLFKDCSSTLKTCKFYSLFIAVEYSHFARINWWDNHICSSFYWMTNDNVTFFWHLHFFALQHNFVVNATTFISFIRLVGYGFLLRRRSINDSCCLSISAYVIS